MINNGIRTKLIENLLALDAAQAVAGKNLEDAECRNCDKSEWNSLLNSETAVIAQWNRLHRMLTRDEIEAYNKARLDRL